MAEFNALYDSIIKQLEDWEKRSSTDATSKLKKKVAAKIYAYRIKHGLSKSGLAEKLGVTRLQIIRWEGAKHKPSNLAIRMLEEKKII